MTLCKDTDSDSHIDILGRAGKHYILRRGIMTQGRYQNPLSPIRNRGATAVFKPTEMKMVLLTVSTLLISWIKSFSTIFSSL